MSTLADNAMTLHAPPASALSVLGRRFVVSWSCTRRERDAKRGRRLVRAACVVAVQPLDGQHAVIECWVESDDARQRTILHSTTRPCAIDASVVMLHLDMIAADGSRLLALSIDLARGGVVYAQSSLLRDAGFAGGTYDPPAWQPAGEKAPRAVGLTIKPPPVSAVSMSQNASTNQRQPSLTR